MPLRSFRWAAALHTPIPRFGMLMGWSVYAADAVRPGGCVSDAHGEETGRPCGLERGPIYGRDRVAVRGGDPRTSIQELFF